MDRYRSIREEAYEASMELPALGLVSFTFGNASAADRNAGVFAIKPSGVPYKDLSPDAMVVLDFDMNSVSGSLRPSSDSKTHALLYRNWEIGGIAHTHSVYATAWAQSLLDIPLLGTTHADHSAHDIPCAEPMSDEAISGDYEHETGWQIIRCLQNRGLDYHDMEMVLVGSHAPFTWGASAKKAVHNSAVLENLAQMAWLTLSIRADAGRMKEALIRKHFERKHGPDSYYGQNENQ